jgi:hypothetical protein
MRGKQAGFIAAQAAIFVAVIALVSLPLSANDTRSSTSSTVSEGPLGLASGVSPEGLQLKMTLNSTSIPSHGALAAQIQVVNTLNQNVSIPMPGYNQTITGLGQTMESLNDFDYTCSQNPSHFLADFALFQGHITAANLSSAGTPLSLNPHFVLFCPPFYDGQGQDTFLRKSNQVIATYDLTNEILPLTAAVNATTFYCTGSELAGGGGEFDCGNTTGLVGYWNASVPLEHGAIPGLNSPAFVYFPPGEYTIVACDAFNQYLYATFVVQAAGSPSATSSASSQFFSSSSSHIGLHELDFVQQERCSYGGWVYPWGVMLNGSKSQTIVQPSNETLGLLYNNDPNNGTYSQIVFWVPNGVYNYTILPLGSFSQSGTVTIRDNGTSINVYQYFLAEGCTSTTTTSTSSAKNP